MWNLKSNKFTRGFTLLEVMIAVAVIAISLVTILGLQSRSLSLAAEARFYTTASLLAQEKMAEMTVTDLKELRSDTGDFGDEFQGYAWRFTVENVAFQGLEAMKGRIKQLDLEVTFGEEDMYQYALRLYRFFPLQEG